MINGSCIELKSRASRRKSPKMSSGNRERLQGSKADILEDASVGKILRVTMHLAKRGLKIYINKNNWLYGFMP